MITAVISYCIFNLFWLKHVNHMHFVGMLLITFLYIHLYFTISVANNYNNYTI